MTTSTSERPTGLRDRDAAWAVAASVVDPELPMLTLADLGVLREVDVEDDGRVVVTITPTYSGCPALATMRADLVRRLTGAGYADVDVRLALQPAWSSDDITAEGCRRLAEAGISPPGRRRHLRCPRCGSDRTELTSEFGATSCKALYRCTDCAEPFEHVKEI